MTLFKLIHLLAVLIWVGGMFFTHLVLRPAAVETLEPPQRLKLLDAVFRRFFNWVWGRGRRDTGHGFLPDLPGRRHRPCSALCPHHAGIGLAMMAIFGYVFFACLRAVQLACRQTALERGGKKYWARSASWSR